MNTKLSDAFSSSIKNAEGNYFVRDILFNSQTAKIDNINLNLKPLLTKLNNIPFAKPSASKNSELVISPVLYAKSIDHAEIELKLTPPQSLMNKCATSLNLTEGKQNLLNEALKNLQ